MFFSAQIVILFSWAAYSNQLDTSRFLIRNHFIALQEQSLKGYFKNAKEGIVILRNFVIAASALTQENINDQQVLFLNSSISAMDLVDADFAWPSPFKLSHLN